MNKATLRHIRSLVTDIVSALDKDEPTIEQLENIVEDAARVSELAEEIMNDALDGAAS